MQSGGNSTDALMSRDSLAGPPSTSCGDSIMFNDDDSSMEFDVNVGILSPNTMLQIDSTFESLMNPVTEGGYDDDFGQTDLLRQGTHMTSTLMSKTLTRKDYSKMNAICDDYAPWQLADASTRVAYAISVFKNFHVDIARNNSTIYMHRNLYPGNIPRWITQAFSVCVLYTNQTQATRGLVLRVLYENVNDLVKTAAAPVLTSLEKLARVHALLVYQTVRMFDGDITLGQQAEDDVPLLEAWNNELSKIGDDLEDFAELDAAEIRSKPPESWERWLFAESVRRTYVISSALKTFWELLKGRGQPADLGTWQNVHRWTLSKHLWNATNPLDFFKSWKEKPIWIISAFGFDKFVQTGTGDDVDEFAMVFLTLTFGVNEMKMFCYETSKRLPI